LSEVIVIEEDMAGEERTVRGIRRIRIEDDLSMRDIAELLGVHCGDRRADEYIAGTYL
jgi:hypothetical protein